MVAEKSRRPVKGNKTYISKREGIINESRLTPIWRTDFKLLEANTMRLWFTKSSSSYVLNSSSAMSSSISSSSYSSSSSSSSPSFNSFSSSSIPSATSNQFLQYLRIQSPQEIKYSGGLQQYITHLWIKHQIVQNIGLR